MTLCDPVAKFTIVIKLRIDNLNILLIWIIFIHVVDNHCKGSPPFFLPKQRIRLKNEATNV